MEDPNKVTYLAETDARNRRIPFGIKAKDRAKHTYVIGKTGMGKSTLLKNMAIQDIRNGNGVIIVDPHGEFADDLLEYVPKERIEDVLYFAPFDLEHPVSFNVMEDVGYDRRHIVASGLMSAFKKIWLDAWSARMEYILSNTILALLEYPDATLLSVNRMLADKAYREQVVATITDPGVKSYWVNEFANYTERFAAEALPAIQNKVGQFTTNPVIRNILGQAKSSFDIRKMMDEKKIIIANLSKGRIGEVASTLLGSLFVTKSYLAAMSRADVPAEVMKSLPDCYLYVDEFQTFANESFADILSEARKYKLALTIAHQYVEQMPEEVRSAVFGNVGTMIVFRVGSFDAEIFEKEFSPNFLMADIVNLGFTQIYLRLMIDGVGSKPFSARTLPQIAKPAQSFVPQILEASRKRYAKQRGDVETAAVASAAIALQPDEPKKRGPSKGGYGGGGGGYDSRPPRRDDRPAPRPAPAPAPAAVRPAPPPEEEWEGYAPGKTPGVSRREEQPVPARQEPYPTPALAPRRDEPRRSEAPRRDRPAPMPRAASRPTPIPAAPPARPAPRTVIDPAAKTQIESFLRELERDAGVAPATAKSTPPVIKPAPGFAEPIHLVDLLKRPPAPGDVKKDADEDRKAALRAALASSLGAASAPAPSPKPVTQSGSLSAAPAGRKAPPKGIPDDELRSLLDI